MITKVNIFCFQKPLKLNCLGLLTVLLFSENKPSVFQPVYITYYVNLHTEYNVGYYNTALLESRLLKCLDLIPALKSLFNHAAGMVIDFF